MIYKGKVRACRTDSFKATRWPTIKIKRQIHHLGRLGGCKLCALGTVQATCASMPVTNFVVSSDNSLLCDGAKRRALQIHYRLAALFPKTRSTIQDTSMPFFETFSKLGPAL